MANNNGRRCGRRNYFGCLERVNGRWENYPYYNGCCPDANGACGDPRDEDREDCGCGRERRRACRQCGIFTATLPMAMAANGVVPLVGGACMGLNNDFPVSCGLITLQDEGTYLATYSVRMPEGADVKSTISLTVNDASQASAVTMVGGAAPNSFTAQAIFDVHDRATVALRSSEAINIPETCPQPMFTLTLVKLT